LRPAALWGDWERLEIVRAMTAAVCTWYSARPTPPADGCKMPVVICAGPVLVQVSAYRKTAKNNLLE
jgi:hypothetical protein